MLTSSPNIYLCLNALFPGQGGEDQEFGDGVAKGLVNGIDAMNSTPELERRLHVATRSYDDDYVEVAIRDSGVGVPQDQLPRIFDSFFTTKPEGMGIGLSIANSIIETHKGRIWAENNRDGKGATFHFTVPVYKPDNGLAATTSCGANPLQPR